MDKIRMTIRLVPALDKYISEIASDRGICKNTIITEACWKFVEKMKRESKEDSK